MNIKGVLSLVLVISSFCLSVYLSYETFQLDAQLELLETLLAKREGELTTLQEEKSNIEDQKDELQAELATFKNENNKLENRLIQLQTEVTRTRDSLTSLQGSYKLLNNDYNSLQETHQLEKELRIGNSLESYYDSLRKGLGLTGAQFWWLNPEKQIWETEIEFAVNLAQHDLCRIYWPAFESAYEELTGENSYEAAWNKLNTTISYMGVSTYDNSTEKISKILSFLGKNIHYEVEVNDIFLAPVETLGFKSGDCDDYSILSAALFECVGIDSAIGFFKNDNDEYHAMVLVHLDELGYYHYRCYDDLTDLGLVNGKWIIIEPQTTIENQGSDLTSQWTILVAKQLEG